MKVFTRIWKSRSYKMAENEIVRNGTRNSSTAISATSMFPDCCPRSREAVNPAVLETSARYETTWTMEFRAARNSGGEILFRFGREAHTALKQQRSHMSTEHEQLTASDGFISPPRNGREIKDVGTNSCHRSSGIISAIERNKGQHHLSTETASVCEKQHSSEQQLKRSENQRLANAKDQARLDVQVLQDVEDQRKSSVGWRDAAAHSFPKALYKKLCFQIFWEENKTADVYNHDPIPVPLESCKRKPAFSRW